MNWRACVWGCVRVVCLSFVAACASGCESAPPSADAGGADASVRCSLHSDCDDGLFCNGRELCQPAAPGADEDGCVLASPACAAPATCNETTDACLADCDDMDGDGHGPTDCGGDDCDDADIERFPGHIEICDVEGHDEDCNDTTVGDRDVDGDGEVSSSCCNGASCGGDCDDTLRGTNHAVPEVCDERDNDCDGAIDEGLLERLYLDADFDGVGDPAREVVACPGHVGASGASGDCDDTRASVRPTAPEICDVIDNDCDGLVDEATTAVPWYVDADGDGWGTVSSDQPSIDSCVAPAGRAIRVGDCDDDDALVSPTARERCNGTDDDCDGRADYMISEPRDTEDDDLDGVPDAACMAAESDCNDRDPLASSASSVEICDDRDNDCDGTVDEGAAPVRWYVDEDGDRFGDPESMPVESCALVPGRTIDATDCDDDDGGSYPGAVDSCFGRLHVDDDCDGVVDEGGIALTRYADLDDDGFGAGEPIRSCLLEASTSPRDGDCDDTDDRVSPAALDDCAALAAVDDDCDGRIDETLTPRTFWIDGDNDGYGIGAPSAGCAQPPGTATMAGDCDDASLFRNPGVPDDCATQLGVDDDCDARTDEDRVLLPYFRDLDGDQYGTDPPTMACVAPAGFRATGGDCDDTNALRHPEAADDCTRPMAVDDDCDGLVDEDALFNTLYRDVDGDGFGSGSSMLFCGSSPGYVSATGDCNESSVAIHPARPDDCTTALGVDDDCDGMIDDGVVLRSWYADADRDGYGTGTPMMACVAPTGHAPFAGDCDDGNVSRSPGRADDCTTTALLDDDCDTRIDEGAITSTFYRDADGDTFGDPTVTSVRCAAGGGFVASSTDCDDSRAAVRPTAVEVCANGLDDDCDTDRDCADSTCAAGCGATTVISGSGQSAAIHAPVALPLRVRVADGGGAPLVGRSVQLSTTGVAAAAYVATTDSLGEVSFTGVRAPFRLGSETVRILAFGTPEITATVTATAPAVGTIFSVLNGRRDTDGVLAGEPAYDGSSVPTGGGLAGASDGTIYFPNQNRIWRVRADGEVQVVAGVGCCATTLGTAVPGPALSVLVGQTDVMPLALDETRNRLYFGSTCGIFAVDLASGMMTNVAGRHDVCAYTGLGGLAVDARIPNVGALVVTDSGVLWASVGGAIDERSLLMIDTAGRIIRVLGVREGDPAIRTSYGFGALGRIPGSDDVLLFGDIEVAGTGRAGIVRVTSGGAMTHVAGGTVADYSDGIDARVARLDYGMSGMMLPSGEIVIAQDASHTIRRISATGIITTIAGTRTMAGDAGDGGPGTSALLVTPTLLTAWRTSHVIFWQWHYRGIRAIW